MNTIKIDDEVLTALKNNADPFEDTPNSVLRRLLGLDSVGSKNIQIKRGKQMDSDEFVKKIIEQYYNYEKTPRKVGRYQYMYQLDNKRVYFQNFSKPTSNLWYRIKASALNSLENENSEIVFTYPVDRVFYPIHLQELKKKLNENDWKRDDLEVNIDPDTDYWREMNWKLDREKL